MTTEQLKQKHKNATWSLNGSELEKHTDISIEFAIKLLTEIEIKFDSLKKYDSANIIHEQIKNLK